MWVPGALGSHRAAGPGFMLGLDNTRSGENYRDLKQRQCFCNSLLQSKWFFDLSSASGSLVSRLLLQYICLHFQEKCVGNPHTEKLVLRRVVLRKEK